jgi:hypothetical protein
VILLSYHRIIEDLQIEMSAKGMMEIKVEIVEGRSR